MLEVIPRLESLVTNIPQVILTPSMASGPFSSRPGMQTRIHHDRMFCVV